MSRLGFIGLGIIGAPVAGHLLSGGHEVFLHTRSSIPDDLIENGGKTGATPKEVAENADVIFTMVPDTPHVDSVLFDKDGVAERVDRG